MALDPKNLVGNWTTSGTQHGWSHPASGAWKGNLVVRANGTTTMRFTDGNVAPSRPGDWSLNGQTFSILDSQGTRWKATVNGTGNQMGGDYDSGPAGAAGGGWSARKI